MKKKSPDFGDKTKYFFIKNIKKWILCPNCKNGKMTFNKKNALWICEDCGYHFSEEFFLNDCVFWFCDECDAYLNSQEGFERKAPKHICRNCGYENDTTFENIKGICTDCGKVLPDPNATLCADCRQVRREKARQWGLGLLIIAGMTLVSAACDEDNENIDYLISSHDDDEYIPKMKFDYVTDTWMQSASEDELRSIEAEMRSTLDNIDYDSDEYLQLDLKRIDVINTISSRFPLNLPHREHGRYLPNDD